MHESASPFVSHPLGVLALAAYLEVQGDACFQSDLYCSTGWKRPFMFSVDAMVLVATNPTHTRYRKSLRKQACARSPRTKSLRPCLPDHSNCPQEKGVCLRWSRSEPLARGSLSGRCSTLSAGAGKWHSRKRLSRRRRRKPRLVAYAPEAPRTSRGERCVQSLRRKDYQSFLGYEFSFRYLSSAAPRSR